MAAAKSTATRTATATKPAKDAALDALLNDAATPAPPTADKLLAIAAQAKEYLAIMQKVAQLEESLKLWKDRATKLQQLVLPGLLDDAHIKELLLDDLELRLKRGEEVYASISRENQKAATDWLIAHHFGSIVKARIIVEVEREDVAVLVAARKALKGAKVGFEETSGVHAGTLKAFVKERLEAGTVLPKAITYHVQPVVEVKPIKARKA